MGCTADRKEVIEKLEYCISHGSMGGHDCRVHCDKKGNITYSSARDNCPNKDCTTGCVITTLREAVELLKAQQPRVLTAEEVIKHYSLPPAFPDDFAMQEDYYEDIQPLYFEFPHDNEDPFIVHWRGHAPVARYLDEWKHTYGKKWRCWSARPTDEQREAVKWDEP